MSEDSHARFLAECFDEVWRIARETRQVIETDGRLAAIRNAAGGAKWVAQATLTRVASIHSWGEWSLKGLLSVNSKLADEFALFDKVAAARSMDEVKSLITEGQR